MVGYTTWEHVVLSSITHRVHLQELEIVTLEVVATSKHD